jgi:RNA polymerase sigma-54 factor
MKPGLQLKLGQQLAITPQLQQAIRLLQLSQLELRQDIQLVLEANPLLELDDEYDEVDVDPLDATSESDQELDLREERFDEIADFENEGPSAGPANSDDFEGGDTPSAAESLTDHLLWQLNLTPLSERDRRIGVFLIESINDDGYLSDSLEALCEALKAHFPVELDELSAVLKLIQRFDPVGVGARNLSEALLIQLGQLDANEPAAALAKSIVAEHLEALGRGDLDRLRRRFKVDDATLNVAIALIRTLDPRPGEKFSDAQTDFVVPDVYVSKRNNRWQVNLNTSALPKLKVNRYYQSLIATAGKTDASYMRGQLQEARWFLRSLEARHDTLKRVATAIVEQQRGFFDSGAEAMQPMVLRDIAELVGLHESTVSRVTARKYMHTPRGVFEFKYFFTSHVGTSDGGECSAVAIQAMLKSLISEESPRKPLSDAVLADTLNQRGIDVARRTVAKYREAMGIATSNERRRLA